MNILTVEHRVLILICYIFILSPYLYLWQAGADGFEIVNKVTSNVLGLTVVILGYYYYQNRKEFDQKNREKENSDKIIKLLSEQFDYYEEALISILLKDFTSKKQLIKLRNTINRRWDNIEALLGAEDMTMSTDRIKKLIELNSFVDNHREIMHKKYSKIEFKKIESISSLFYTKIKEAKGAIFRS
ncbi:hypothetical protein HGB47_16470 [Leptospira yasudae]|uniref:hypothetical protein n=1 Tax=Leptospira yasudae TaxID=2202201 RepID=UPI001C4F465E|nr:hypothetical protein [Leptospira yasudae]MBW0435208.1 hypothetical protein [Leptospira yasudae]